MTPLDAIAAALLYPVCQPTLPPQSLDHSGYWVRGYEECWPPTAIGFSAPELHGSFWSAGTVVTILGADQLSAHSASDRLTSSLGEYKSLRDNWDGEGAKAPSPDAVDHAIAMVRCLPADIVLPKPMTLASGHVALYWDFGVLYAEIGFDGSGKYYAYASGPDFEPIYIDDAELIGLSGGIIFPPDMKSILS